MSATIGRTALAHGIPASGPRPDESRPLAEVGRILRAIHSWEASRINCGGRPASEEQKRERPPVEHPLVRAHPDTGAKVLYLGNHASHIAGMPDDDGRTLLAQLQEHATQAAFVYTHRWQPGDLVLWDNRCLVHRVLPHEGRGLHRRVLHRTVVKGTVPY